MQDKIRNQPESMTTLEFLTYCIRSVLGRKKPILIFLSLFASIYKRRRVIYTVNFIHSDKNFKAHDLFLYYKLYNK